MAPTPAPFLHSRLAKKPSDQSSFSLNPSPLIQPSTSTAHLLNQFNNQLPSSLPFAVSISKSNHPNSIHHLNQLRSPPSHPSSQNHAHLSTPSYPFSPPHPSPPTSHSLSSSSPALKLDMMAKLLCTQALIDSSSFQMLSFDRVEHLKKHILKLEHKLDSLNSNISLEIKIRHASSIILSTAPDPPDHPPDDHPDRDLLPNPTLDKLRAEKDALQIQLHSARTRLLQHLAAVLGLGLKKLEHQLHPPPVHSPLDRSPRLPIRSSRSASPAQTNRSSRSTALTLDRFDGPHLFANNLQLATPPRSIPAPPPDTGQADALAAELKRLNTLLAAKEATIAEQASDLSLLELELDTLKHARAKASSAHSDALQTRNDALSDQIAKLRIQAEASERWRTEADALRADLERERASGSGQQETIVARAREAEDRAREAERVRAELSARIESHEADAARVRAEMADLGARAQAREGALEEQLAQLRAEAAEHAAQAARQSDAHSREWDELVDRLAALRPSDATGLGRLVGRLAGLAPARPPRAIVVEELVEGVEEHFRLVEQSEGLRMETEEVRRSHGEERDRLEARISELEKQVGVLESERQALEGRAAETSEMEAVQAELALAKKQLEEAETHVGTDKVLRELYKTLPSNLDGRAGVGQESELAGFRSAYEQPQKAAAGLGGLGGLFGLGKRAATPTQAPEEPNGEYSVDAFVEKVKNVVESDKKLVERLAKYEAEKDQHKSNALRAQKLVTESQEALRTYQQQVRELEERLEYADTQSAAMLEKVNDLMESEEKANMAARRSESQTMALHQQLNSVQAELASLRATHATTLAGSASMAELRAARDQVDDLVAEMEEVKNRERRERERFLEQVREAQDEAGALRSRVRVLERAQKA